MNRSRELRWVLPALALVAALALTVRVVPAWNEVFGYPPPPPGDDVAATESGVRLLGVDSYFHLRHARHAAAHFPSLMRYDPWTAYPNVARIREVGLYDLATGGAAWALGGGHPDERLLQQVLAWTPVVLGVTVHLALFAAVAALWGPVTGLVAAVLLLAYPGPFLDRSLLGFSDYHVAEVLLVLLLLRAMARLLPGTRTGPRTPQQGVGRGVAAAVPLLVFHITWVGAPMWLFLTGTALLVGAAAAVVQREGGTARAGIVACGTTFTLGILALSVAIPDAIQEPAVLPGILLTGTAVALLLPTWSLVVDKAVARRGGSPGLAGGVILMGGLAGTAGVILFTPPGRELWTILTGVRTELVAEHILVWWEGLSRTVSYPGLMAAAAPIAVFLRARRTGRWTEMAPVTLALMGMAVALRTGDFDYLLAPAAAFLAAGLAVEVAARVQGARGWVRWTPTVAFLVLLLAPVAGAAGPAHPWRDTAEVRQFLHLEEPWVDALRWLRSSTPDPRRPGVQTDGKRPDPEAAAPFRYGVLTAWDHGNVVASLAERPVLWSQGPSPVTAGLLLAPPGEELERLLTDVGAPLRYVAVDDRILGPWFRAKVLASGRPPDSFVTNWTDVTLRGHRGMLVTYGPAFDRSLAHRLYYGEGDGLGHFRLVYQSREESLTGYLARPTQPEGFDVTRVRRRLMTEAQRTQAVAWAGAPGQVTDLGEDGFLYGVQVEPTVRIYERVEGARLEGEAPPARRVHVAIMIRPGRDGGDREPFLWESTAEADAAGRWEVRVPYATDPAPEEGRVGAESTYRVFLLPDSAPTSGQLSSQNTQLLADGIQVTESQTREGAVVRVPIRSGRR